ncbi:o-succinylbenzoate synthase [Priestia megaterium]|nr:o-succinylbenzoate synthase [Priestia megaterium]
MKIQKVRLHVIELNLLSPFSTSYGTIQNRELILIEVEDDNGEIGWGEVVAFSTPWYTEETIKTCFHMLDDFLIPSLLGQTIAHPQELQHLFKSLKRNHMAKAAVDCAVWDLFAKKQNKSLSAVLGGTREKVEAGVVIGLDKPLEMMKKIEKHLLQGYKRFKIKIKPGSDYELVKEIRYHFPNLPLMVDANSSYSLSNISQLQKLDEFNLLMIEQPLHSDDIVDHRLLQQQIQTSICLDESIVSYEDARKAIELESCQVINVKVGRVGGLTEAKRIHDLCRKYHIKLWVGGMLESGISRAHNVALASLPHFTIPGDISSSSRYWKKDIITPEVEVHDGFIHVPTEAGIGYNVDKTFLEKVRAYAKEYSE